MWNTANSGQKWLKKLWDLKVAELRRELEDRDLEASEKKAELTKWLKQVIGSESLDPEMFLVSNDAPAILSSIFSLLKRCLLERFL